MFKNIENRIKNSSFVINLINITKERSLPGLGAVPVYYVGHYFTNTLKNGALATKASSLAFNFFLAIFPAILFLFSLIPFVFPEDFLFKLLEQIRTFLPLAVKNEVMETLAFFSKKQEGVLFLNIILALYFASNGIVNLMTQFNSTYLFKEKQVWWKQRLMALGLVVILTALILTAVILTSLTHFSMDFAIEKGWINGTVNWILINTFRWIIVFALFYFAISFLYYFGPAKRKSWTFFSAGSSVATLMIITSSIGFSFYITHFSRYNAIYGSIGTIVIIMLYFQLNSFILLLGFELNASIRKGKSNDKFIAESN
jgi:membrane protein